MVNKIAFAKRHKEPIEVISLLSLKKKSMNSMNVRLRKLLEKKKTDTNPSKGPSKPRTNPSFRLFFFRKNVATFFQI